MSPPTNTAGRPCTSRGTLKKPLRRLSPDNLISNRLVQYHICWPYFWVSAQPHSHTISSLIPRPPLASFRDLCCSFCCWFWDRRTISLPLLTLVHTHTPLQLEETLRLSSPFVNRLHIKQLLPPPREKLHPAEEAEEGDG